VDPPVMTAADHELERPADSASTGDQPEWARGAAHEAPGRAVGVVSTERSGPTPAEVPPLATTVRQSAYITCRSDRVRSSS
jgi:hypothetical protein